jgi:hypothetical protein
VNRSVNIDLNIQKFNLPVVPYTGAKLGLSL